MYLQELEILLLLFITDDVLHAEQCTERSQNSPCSGNATIWHTGTVQLIYL